MKKDYFASNNIESFDSRGAGKSRKGFTLAELLIVVAIIGVLVAISIPIFAGQLTKAKLATDQANVRSAKAAAAAEYMTDGETGIVNYLYDGGKAIKLSSSSPSVSGKGYGKSDRYEGTGAISGIPKDGYVEVSVDGTAQPSNTQIKARWVSSAGASAIATGNLVISGTLTTASLKKQVADAGLNSSEVTSFTASSGTDLNEPKNGDTLQDLFAGYSNLKKIDLSQATLTSGNAYLFRNIPDSVEEIVLPKATSDYNIYGKWYDKDGEALPSAKYQLDKFTNQAEHSRVCDDQLKAGDTIYRRRPAGK